MPVDDLAHSRLRHGRTEHLSWYMPISICASGLRVLSKGTASWSTVLWFAPAMRCICPFIVLAPADGFCSHPSHEGSIARHTTLDARGGIDLYWSFASEIARN